MNVLVVRDVEVAKRALIEEELRPSAVVDATRLERNLNLVLQIIEITDKVVVCLNLIDEARRRGITVDPARTKYRLLEAGAEVIVAGLEAGRVHKGKHGYPERADVAVDAVDADALDGLVVPGGWMPDKLRRYESVLDIVRRCEERAVPIASICHGPWIDISAGVVRGYRYTSTPGIQDDLVNAGAEWIDAEAPGTRTS